ncbi:unnamed protein product [Cylindrotheca closterium]|uniref:Leucine-rich repeat-containing N-terminal plant-type domain-containing protein n=1 Tax=Cylindrotheca closterium TaxID=2856 RepID=A0AAD2FNY8_9STRA|nr:unnamed protein product [Cylindrotheca closterium]
MEENAAVEQHQLNNSGWNRRKCAVIAAIIVGLAAIGAGVGVAVTSGNEESIDNSVPTPSVLGDRRITTPGPTPFNGSSASLEENVFDFLTNFVDEQTLLDERSYTFSAYNWLMKNSTGDHIYFKDRIRQRFSLACIYYATKNTNDDEGVIHDDGLVSVQAHDEGPNRWIRDDKWLSDEDHECSWMGVRCINGNIVALNLTSNGLKGVFPMEVMMLKTYLLALQLGDNDRLFNKDQELRWLGQLSLLRLLDVRDTGFTNGGIPSYIGRLTDLRILEMANSKIPVRGDDVDGTIFKNLTQLVYLDIGGIQFNNNTFPDAITQLPRLEALYASNCGFEGKLESLLIPNSRRIQEIRLDNNNLSGQVPTSIHELYRLGSLSIRNNSLSGSLPTELGLMTHMTQLWLSGNLLSGAIPSEIGSMMSLQVLGLEGNKIRNETMPSEICDLGLVSLGADCKSDVACSSDCCTCCEPPCPVVDLW